MIKLFQTEKDELKNTFNILSTKSTKKGNKLSIYQKSNPISTCLYLSLVHSSESSNHTMRTLPSLLKRRITNILSERFFRWLFKNWPPGSFYHFYAVFTFWSVKKSFNLLVWHLHFYVREIFHFQHVFFFEKIQWSISHILIFCSLGLEIFLLPS